MSNIVLNATGMSSIILSNYQQSQYNCLHFTDEEMKDVWAKNNAADSVAEPRLVISIKSYISYYTDNVLALIENQFPLQQHSQCF